MHVLSGFLCTAVLAAALSAQTASYALFGDSCGTPCASLNDNRAPIRTGTLTNEYAFGHRFASATVIQGFQLYTQTAAAPVFTIPCHIYRESTSIPGTPDLTPFATSSMTVLNTPDLYSVFFSPPVIVMANELIFIAQGDSQNVLAAGLAAAGNTPTVPTYWRRVGLPWAVTGVILYPAYRILCGNDLAFSATGVPRLGASMTLTLQSAPSNAPALVFFGTSNPNLTIPFCTKLYANPFLAFTATTSATGVATLPLAIPNDPALNGARFWNQWWAVAPGPNVIGTNGGHGIAGN